VVGWKVYCGVVWGGRRKKSLVRGSRRRNGCPPNLQTRQNKNQPKREILDNGENPETNQSKKLSKMKKIQKFAK